MTTETDPPSDRFVTTDGLSLRTRLDVPAGQPRVRAVIIHGIGDHVDGLPYVLAGRALAAHGCVAYRLELRGHGRSGGSRVYVREWSDFRNDLRHYVEQIGARAQPLPTFLIGVSMGGLVVADYALHHPDGLSGVVAVAPALGDTGGSRLLLGLLPLLARLAPRLRLDPKLDLARVTRDAQMLEAYITDDPLYQRKVTPRLANCLVETIAAVRAHASRLSVPLLIQHGAADTVTSPAGSREFFERAGVADKTYTSYEGAYHNLFAETNRDEVVWEIARWMMARAEQ